MNALVSLSLDPGSLDTDFLRVKYHKDQENDKDYSHEGAGFKFKKWQADHVPQTMDNDGVKFFEADKEAGKQNVRQHGSGTQDGGAPLKDF